MNAEQKFLVNLLGNSGGFLPVPKDINWQNLIFLAQSHCLFPLFFRQIQSYCGQVPKNIFDNLQEKAKEISLQNLVFNAQLINLTNLFEAHKIAFLAYKGGTLAQIAYGDSTLRQFGDLDILIHKKDFAKVKKTILENGGKSAWELTGKQEKAVLKYYYELPFLFGENQVPLEVHWAFMESFFAFNLSIDKVFEQSKKISVHGKEIPTPSNEDLLLLLCVHGSKHFWTRLSWICDVAKLIQRQPIDWDAAVKRAKDSGCLRMLKLGVFLACDIFKAEPPNDFSNETDEKINLLVEKLKNQIFENIPLPESERTAIHLQMRERLRDKFKYSHRLFTTKLIDSLFMPMGRPQ